jgi:hypothetical protein
MRSTTSRLFRFWCWLWYNHTHEVGSHTTSICDRCGQTLIGSD